MIKESSYVTLCMDPMSSRIYFVSEDGRKSTQAPAGAKVRVPTDMNFPSDLCDYKTVHKVI